MRKTLIAAALLASFLAPLGGTASASAATDPPSGGHLADELIVGYTDEADSAERRAVRHALEARSSERIIDNAVLLRLPEAASLSTAAARAESMPGVAYAELNGIARLAAMTPTDPLFYDQWALENTGQVIHDQRGIVGADVNAIPAWDAMSDLAPPVVVAVADTGVDLHHEDLEGAGWRNPGERPANGIDDDHNGFIDDVNGYDFAAGDADPSDTVWHGTHVAGIIGARGYNGKGVIGVAPQSRLMAVRVWNMNGLGSEVSIARGFRYAANNGARIVSASLAVMKRSDLIRDVISDYPNVLFVVAAGNDSRIVANRAGIENDPCSAPGKNLICVAATDNRDQLTSWSNRGAESVDLGAPGSYVVSTMLDGTKWGKYFYSSGTSMATPMVSGVAADLLREDPTLTPAKIKSIILRTTDPLPSLRTTTVSGGRLDMAAALAAVGAPVSLAPETKLLAHPLRKSNSADAGFRIGSDRKAASFHCKLDKEPWRSCSSSLAYAGLTPGKHEFQAKAILAGVRDPSPVRWSWTVRTGRR